MEVPEAGEIVATSDVHVTLLQDTLYVGSVPAGECFGEMTLMAPPPHERKKKYTLTCTAEQCEIVNIDGADFLRLLEKSRCMVRSMERLRAERERQNRQAEEKPS